MTTENDSKKPVRTGRRKAAGVAAGLAILGMFAVFAGDGLGGYFGADEMMNLWAAWSPPLGQLIHHYRPLGVLLYRVLFAWFGLNPLPYRMVCFALLATNLLLLYRWCARLAGSREAAALACLVGAYHAHLADFYYASAIIFDLLCFFFSYLAMVRYFGIRARGGRPNGRQTAGLLLLYACALASKEMAVALPAYVILYELLYAKERPRLAAGGWFGWLSVAVTLPYMAYKTLAPQRLTLNPDFMPHLGLHAFAAGWKQYLFDLFYGLIRFNSFEMAALWVVLLAVAVTLRRRELLMAWCVMMIGALPFIFLAPRGFYVMYMTLPGWYLYAGSALVLLREWLERSVPRAATALAIRPGQLALFVVVAAALVPLHHREKPLGNSWVPAEYAQTRPVLEQLARLHPTLPHGARLLFLSDPYPADDQILYFMCALMYRDKDLRVDRVKAHPELADEAVRARYDHVFRLGARGLEEVAH
jgi:hypothetical protein